MCNFTLNGSKSLAAAVEQLCQWQQAAAAQGSSGAQVDIHELAMTLCCTVVT
jgi:hypothetical protein